jgi:hypothetical protein
MRFQKVLEENPEEHETLANTQNPTVFDRLYRKAELRCSYCRPHKGENSRRKPKEDRHKNKNRDSIRKIDEEEEE